MAEFDKDKLSGWGYDYDPAQAMLDLYHLAAVFEASPGIYKLCGEYEGSKIFKPDGLLEAFKLIESSEVSKRLISVAALVRNTHENRHPIARGIHKNSVTGRLKESGNGWSDLTIREACNKILHAEDLRLDTSNTDNYWLGYIKPKVYLYGSHGKKKWKAIINIRKFITFAYEILY